MTAIYGGLFLENLVKQDKYFELQIKLFEKGIIQGIQLRVAHPSFTPSITTESLPRILSVLPDGFKLFVHCGAENVGVDFGENFDECGVFKEQKHTNLWVRWNTETLEWALKVAQAVSAEVVVHPGYGLSIFDKVALKRVTDTLMSYDGDGNIFLENIPAIINKEFPGNVGKSEVWKYDKYWGFGGTPDDMAMLLEELGTGWKCLIDFTHLIVTVNQANNLNGLLLQNCKNIEKVVENYFNLPYCPICHFSGIPPSDLLVDSHDYLQASVLSPIRDAIRQMDAVCLEIPFLPDEPDVTQREIEIFRKKYLA